MLSFKFGFGARNSNVSVVIANDIVIGVVLPVILLLLFIIGLCLLWCVLVLFGCVLVLPILRLVYLVESEMSIVLWNR